MDGLAAKQKVGVIDLTLRLTINIMSILYGGLKNG